MIRVFHKGHVLCMVFLNEILGMKTMFPLGPNDNPLVNYRKHIHDIMCCWLIGLGAHSFD
jgi:hypothetical protein